LGAGLIRLAFSLLFCGGGIGSGSGGGGGASVMSNILSRSSAIRLTSTPSPAISA
jgi:hypothetical protein